MAQSVQWRVKCKNFHKCKNYLEYSGGSYERGLASGKSRPEYCPDCQKEHSRQKKTMGQSYFRVVPTDMEALNAAAAGSLGKVKHVERKHESTIVEGKFDPSKFGVKVEDIQEIFGWLFTPEHQVAIVVGPTGSGKSTALPYWMLNPPKGFPQDLFLKHGQILITQPRIIATVGITKFLATELIGGKVGSDQEIGFRHSGNVQTSWRNALAMCTDGTLINMIEKGDLDRFSLIMIDEAHERSTNIDLILRLMKEKLPLYPHLKLVIASATIDADTFLNYFGKKTAKIINFEGKRKYSYEPVIFRDPKDALPYTKDSLGILSSMIASKVASKVYGLLEEIFANPEEFNDILAFLPGMKSIDEAVSKLRSMINQNGDMAGKVDVLPLYRDRPQSEKDKILDRKLPKDHVMVVVSTNIAEASITIDSIVYVVDAGLENQSQYDKGLHVTKIPTIVTSRANAKQRWGRAGRSRDGKVHCLYTEEQFNNNNIFDDWPIPELQRTSMESTLLAAKATGLSNLREGWLQNPSTEFVDDAFNALQKSGALDESGILTTYGLWLRHLSYPAQVADLIMLSDQLGCSVEIATLIPVIKNGGLRQFLSWEWSWDAYTKRHALAIQKGLMSGCIDDIDFVIKLYAAWSDMPWLDQDQLKRLAPKKFKELQKEWCKHNFVRNDILEEIEKERNEILERFFVHKKDKDFRPINFSLIARTKLLLSYCLPENGTVSYSNADKAIYEFQTKIEPNPESFASFMMSLPTSWTNIPHRTDNPISLFDVAQLVGEYEGIDRSKSKQERAEQSISKYFLDQIVKIGSVYQATPIEYGFNSVKLEYRVLAGGFEAESFTIKVPEEAVVDAGNSQLIVEEAEIDEGEDSPETENKADVREETEPLSLENQLHLKSSRLLTNIAHISEGSALKPEDSSNVKVLSYVLTNGNTTPIVSWIPKEDPFYNFSNKQRVGSVVNIKTNGFFQAPLDKTASLIVSHEETGLEILVDAEDLTFSSSPYPAQNTPVGINLSMTVAQIDTKRKRVRLSLLSSVEAEITRQLNANTKKTRLEVESEVVGIRDDGLVTFALSTCNPEHALFLMVNTWISKLKGYEVVLGSKFKISVLRHTHKDNGTNLNRIPTKVRKKLERGDIPNLSWQRGYLTYSGHMGYGVYRNLTTLSNDENYLSATTRIWWFSNRIMFGSIFNQAWVDAVSKEFPVGTEVKALVTSTHKGGVSLEAIYLGKTIKGYAPWDHILGKSVSRPDSFFKDRNPSVTARVSLIKGDEEVEFDIISVEDDPFLKIEKGDEIVGSVINESPDAYYIEVAPGMDGQLNKKQTMYDVAASSLKPGDMVKVRVFKIDTFKRHISLDFISLA